MTSTSRSADGGPPTVVFLHLGKPAGATLRRILRRNVPGSRTLQLRNPRSAPNGFLSSIPVERFAELPEAERERPRLIMAHMMYGIHEHIPRETTYITLLRHPVARALSGYKSARYWSEHRFHDVVVREDMDVAAYLRSGLALELDNSQTRAIIADTTTPYGACTQDMLDRAKAIVGAQFAVVGIAERFDESLLAIRRELGWSRLTYVNANVSRRKIARSDVPAETLRMIEAQNWLDLELYRYAGERLDAVAGPALDRELERFQRANARYRVWGTLTYTLPKRARGAIGA
jgi:hypothetical protein